MDKELAKIIKQLRDLGVAANELEKMEANFNAIAKAGGDTAKQLDLMRNRVEFLKDAVEFSKESFTDLSTIIQKNTDELGKGNVPLNEALRLRRSTRDISKEMLLDEQGLGRLSELDLKKRITKLQQNQVFLDSTKERLKEEFGITDNLTDQDDIEKQILEKLEEKGIKGKEATKEAENIQTILNDQNTAEKGLLLKAQARLKTEQEINDKMGLTGDLIRSAGGLMQKLGLDSKILGDALEEAEEAMRTAAEHGSQFSVMLAGAGKLAKGFGKALLDPAAITATIVKGFMSVNKAQVESIRLTGAATTAFSNFSGKVAATSEVLEQAAESTRKLGIDANQLFGAELLTSLTYFRHELGLSGDEATRLGMIQKLTGQTIESINSSISQGASEMNAQNKSAVPLGIILNDVLNASEDITASLGNNPEALARAATAARALGMDLAKVDSIADGLLDFESSIGAEMEAQLLTGKNINLSKARQLALNNDLEGVANELAKQGASAAEFANMNRIQQESMAKAMGMSRQELAKMVMTQDAASKLTDEQRAKVMGVTVEQLKAEDIQKRMNRALMQLGESFAPILDALVPVVKAIVYPISLFADTMTFILKGFDDLLGKGSILANTLKLAFGAGMIMSIGIVKKAISNALNPNVAGNLFQNLKKGFDPKNLGLDKLRGTLKKLFGAKDSPVGEITKDAQGRFRDAKGRFAKAPVTQDATKKLTDSAKSMPKDTKGAGGGMKGLTDAISKIDPKKLLAGAAAMVIAAGAVFVFAKATQEFMEVSWSAVGKAVVSLGVLVAAVAALGVIMSSGVGAIAILAGAGAMVIMAGALYILGKAMQEIGTGLGLIGEGVVNIGTTVDGEMVARLFSLGPALASAAAGIGLFGLALAGGGIASFFGGGIMSDIQTLANLAPNLAEVGTSLTAIAAGLAGIALALNTLETEKLNELKGLIMTTAFAAPVVAATGAITDLISGITGGQQGNNDAVAAKIDELIAVVKEGGDVFIDGSKAGNALVLASSKSS